MIFNHYTNAVVLIDDFKVEDDAGYGFDHYVPDKELTLADVRNSAPPETVVLLPTTQSREEAEVKGLDSPYPKSPNGRAIEYNPCCEYRITT